MMSWAIGLVLCVLCYHASAEHINVQMMQVTDIHGWIAGHPHDDNLNTDYGDFTSLLEHVSNRSKEEEKTIFLLFDSGDLVEGTGISDQTYVHGRFIWDLTEQIREFTAFTVGNHDIGADQQADYLENNFVPSWNRNPPPRYLTSNAYMKKNMQPIGERYSVLDVGYGIKMLVMGFIYNFTQNSNNTFVTFVEDAVQESWFVEAMQVPDVDIYVVTAHIDPSENETLIQAIYQAVRSYHRYKPLVLFSGHRHILYYEWYDNQSFTLEAGKYFEVLGLVNFTFDTKTKKMRDVEYMFMPTTLDNFYTLSQTTEENFLTDKGKVMKEEINIISNKLNLTFPLGCSQMYYDLYADISNVSSIWNLWINIIIPQYLFPLSTDNLPYFFTNAYALRDNVYQGVQTNNDVVAVMPFDDIFDYSIMTGSQLLGLIQNLNGSSPLPHRKDRAPNVPKPCPHTIIKGKLGENYHQKVEDDDEPSWYLSQLPVDPEAVYNVISSNYDYITTQDEVVSLGGKPMGQYFYPGTETDLWRSYWPDDYPCGTSTCQCS